MKHSIIIAIIFGFLLPAAIYSAEPSSRYTVGTVAIGGYMAITGKASTINVDHAGYVDLRTAATLDESWGIGIGVSGLYYDKKLSALVTDGTYHLNAGYMGFYVEKFFPLSNAVSVSVSLLSGIGAAEYLYDKEYRKQMRWSVEVIDRATFSVLEPGMEVSYRVSSELSIGMSGSYRTTSPILLINTSETLFDEFNYGVAMKWQFF